MVHKLIFLYFAAVILISAVLTVTRKNPIHSVLYMLLLFFHIAGVFVLLNAEFLAAVQIIVYAGAILILCLFVVMLLSINLEATADRANRFWPWLTGFSVLIAGEIGLLVVQGRFPADAGHPMREASSTGVGALGIELYTNYLVPFEVASIILLVGLVGAVMLAKKTTKE